MNKDSCKAAFTARVHRYLYSKDSNDESEEIEIAGIIDNTHHAATSFDPRPDPRDKLLERREEFIRSQLAIVKRMQLKGILSVSSKQSVEEPATTCTSEPVGFGDECSAEKDDKVPQTRKNRKRKLKKKRRKEQQLIAKKLKEETASDLGGDIVDNTSGHSNILYTTTVDNTTNDTIDSTLSSTGDSIGKVILPGDGNGIPGCTPGDTDNITNNIPSNNDDLTDSTPSDIPTS